MQADWDGERVERRRNPISNRVGRRNLGGGDGQLAFKACMFMMRAALDGLFRFTRLRHLAVLDGERGGLQRAGRLVCIEARGNVKLSGEELWHLQGGDHLGQSISKCHGEWAHSLLGQRLWLPRTE